MYAIKFLVFMLLTMRALSLELISDELGCRSFVTEFKEPIDEPFVLYERDDSVSIFFKYNHEEFYLHSFSFEIYDLKDSFGGIQLPLAFRQEGQWAVSTISVNELKNFDSVKFYVSGRYSKYVCGPSLALEFNVGDIKKDSKKVKVYR